MRLAPPTGCAPCVKINLRGVWPVTQGSLAWPALNRRLRSYWRMADGEFLRAAYPLHTSSNPQRANSTDTPRTNTFVWNWRVLSTYQWQTRRFDDLKTQSGLKSNGIAR